MVASDLRRGVLAEKLDRGGLAAAAGLGDLHANVLAGLEIVDPGPA
jgi:hypothetical protein